MIRTGLNTVLMLGPCRAGFEAIRTIFSSAGWTLRPCATPEELIHPGANGSQQPALALLDGADLADAAGWIAQIRALPGLSGATPLLLVGDGAGAEAPGLAGTIALPVDPAAAVATITEWTGPLGDRGFRDPAAADYRLVRLVGWHRAAGMLARLAAQLDQGAVALDAGLPDPALAHRIAGVAGLYGFADLGACWQRLQQGDSAALDEARALTAAARAGLAGWAQAAESPQA